MNLRPHLTGIKKVPKASPKFQNVTGIILAGGKSRRYGKNKAFVKFEGTPLIERVVAVIGSVFERLLLVTNTPEEYAHLGIPMVQDLIKGLGPLGGIYTGLESIPEEAGFFAACDMPFLNAPLLRYMVGLWDEDHDAVVPRIQWMIEPLHALYSRNSLGAMKALIASGKYQIFEVLSRIRTRWVEETTLRTFDPALRCFANVNRPQDMEELARC